MTVRGWVYVLASKGSPALVKVGYSTKDPALRAAELDGTGVPYPYVVEYDALVENPRDIEQAAHRLLWESHANKEFFETDVMTAVQAIRQAASNAGRQLLLETEGEKLKSLSRQSFSTREPLQNRAPLPVSKNKPALRKFSGRSYALTCRHCGYYYSVAQMYSDEQGDAECPRCRTVNKTPI